jgi:hypothetical protein
MDRKGLAILFLLAVILYLLFAPKTSGFDLGPKNGGVVGSSLDAVAAAPAPNMMGDVSSASLIPREVVQTEDFGQFSPDKILSGQNYLDPRSQIGYPETVGGVLRNANQQFRSEPINPRTPVSIFNLSTIPPDTMRPKFEISPEYQ